MADKNDYEYGQRPEEDRMFSTEEVAVILDVTGPTVSNIAKKTKVVAERRKNKRGGGCSCFYTWQQIRIMIEFHDSNKPGTNKQNNKSSSLPGKNKSIEQLRKEHPLVKDARFFSLSYFPAIIPNCFEEIDSWIV